jgi:hypothetical protein
MDCVPIGTQSIEVTALGLSPRRYAVDVRPGGESAIAIELNERIRSLDTIRTVARHTGAAALRDEFDMRALHGVGQYITEDMIKRTQPWITSDLLRYTAGFEFRNDTVFTRRGEYSLGGATVCSPMIMIDGRPADSVNEVLPISIHGMEIYRSEITVPIQFSSTVTATGCGAIFIWTK